MDRARATASALRADIYPYLAGSANLSQLLPGWAHEGGTQAMVERLRTPSDARAHPRRVAVHAGQQLG